MTAIASQLETVTLRGGLTIPLRALQIAWDLEERGISLRLHPTEAGRLLAAPSKLLTDTDRAAMRQHREALVQILALLRARRLGDVNAILLLHSPTCRNLVKSGRCPKHARGHEQQRGSRHQRGYDHAWRKCCALGFLKQEYPWFCAIGGPTCTARDRQMDVGEVDVDHIVVPFQGLDDPRRLESSNLRCVCRSCHGARHGRGPRGGR